MGQMVEVTIPQVLIYYDPEELARWRKREVGIVPEKLLTSKGPGMENGYGYGEFVAERHLIGQGHDVIKNDFDLYSKVSKYAVNNKRIEQAIGTEGYLAFQSALRNVYNMGVRIEHPDLCIIGPEIFFAEVKRDRDRLRDPQKMFAAVLKAVLGLPFVVYKILPYGTECDLTSIEVSVEVPDI